MTCQEIIDILQEQSKESYACGWDNVGLLVGDAKKEIHTIYIALDAEDTAIEEAVREGADLLLTHHPMIFHGLKKINTEDFIGRRVIRLIRNDISCYAMHTNFDVKGMAELSAERMELEECSVLQMTCEDEDGIQGIGRIGRLKEPMSLGACAEKVKEAFDVSKVKVFGDLQKQVVCAAICPGSGKSVIPSAIAAGASVLITGDIDHHEGIDAAAQGLAIIDAGHYGVEKLFIPYMQQYLSKRLPGIRVVVQPPKEPFVYV